MRQEKFVRFTRKNNCPTFEVKFIVSQGGQVLEQTEREEGKTIPTVLPSGRNLEISGTTLICLA
jgi:hypothetical protein